MPVIPNNVDWSATAAWIALVISILGTILSPIITSRMNNRHELKTYKLKRSEERNDKILQYRIDICNSFISNVGKYISVRRRSSYDDLGSSYFAVYQFLSSEQRLQFNEFFDSITEEDWAYAISHYDYIINTVTELLKETRQQPQ